MIQSVFVFEARIPNDAQEVTQQPKQEPEFVEPPVRPTLDLEAAPWGVWRLARANQSRGAESRNARHPSSGH